MRSGIFIASALAVAASSGVLSAQTFPSKPVMFVVPYAAGGNVDVSARIVQAAIGDSLGAPIVVENRTGAGGTIAGDYVARAAPDGQTLFVGSNGPILLGPMTMPNAPYQWDQVFAPISTFALATNVLLVRNDLPVKSVAELVDYARRNPDKLTVAIDSVASINHFMAELLRLKTSIAWTEVHYRGNAPAINDLIAGHVDVGFQQLVDSLQQIRAGRLRALAVLGPTRSAALPDVPTIAEAGFPDVQGITFNGLFAPKHTPRPVIDTLNAAVRKALQQPSVADRLASLGTEAHPSSPEEFATFLAAETRKWTDVMKQANIKVTE